MTLNRQRIVGTRLGHFAMRSRAALEYWSATRENVGTIANDQLAELLITRLAERSFVDIGAHIGSIIAEVETHCSGVQIVAVEPIPEKAQRLRDKFKGVKIIECALADYEGETSFFINVAASGYSSLAQTAGETREIRVAVKRLDALVTDADVIKIDVEGAELGVLRGSEGLKSRPVILFESAPHEVLGYTKPDLWSWFAAHQYGVFVPNRLAHTAPAMSLEVFIDSHHYPRRTTNYFGVPLERVDSVRNKARQILKL
jgi:FkbM family methyltransferase